MARLARHLVMIAVVLGSCTAVTPARAQDHAPAKDPHGPTPHGPAPHEPAPPAAAHSPVSKKTPSTPAGRAAAPGAPGRTVKTTAHPDDDVEHAATQAPEVKPPGSAAPKLAKDLDAVMQRITQRIAAAPSSGRSKPGTKVDARRSAVTSRSTATPPPPAVPRVRLTWRTRVVWEATGPTS